MFIMLVVGLYTSRVTLIALGVTDYGIYNVVGGIVTMFVFINYAMVNSTQRYITYELGKGNLEKLKIVFSTSNNIHAIIAIIIFILSETIGLWFIYNKMVIPPERLNAALLIYQFSVFTCIISVLSAPYNALIIAHEKMDAFAFISLFEASIKLGIVLVLRFINYDRLILYGALLMVAAIIIRIIYTIYCRRKFEESEYHFVWDKVLILEMSKFASWNLVGNLAYVSYTQGLNIVLNMFFSPIVNAARGVAVQVQSVIANFSYNIENAIKPQITKSYAQGDKQRMQYLISASAKLSFFVLLLLSMPVFLEAEELLNIWLAEVPEHTANFVRLTILILLADSLTGPLLTAAQATGDIKKYQLTVSLLCLLILPFAYITLLLIPIPEYVFIVNLVVTVIAQFFKLFVVGRQINMSKKDYIKNVFLRSCAVLLCTFFVVFPLRFFLEESLMRLFVICIVSVFTIFAAIYLFGINRVERDFIYSKLMVYINSRKHKLLKL